MSSIIRSLQFASGGRLPSIRQRLPESDYGVNGNPEASPASASVEFGQAYRIRSVPYPTVEDA
jgi:hypothetical protein